MLAGSGSVSRDPAGWVPPAPGTGARWRDVVLGCNDGLVATTGLLAGLAGSGTPLGALRIAAISAVWAAMVSMAIGSYLGTRSQMALQKAIVAREQWEMTDHPAEELQEMEEIYRGYGFSAEETSVILRALARNPRLWLTLMVRDEHGVLMEAGESPALNALIMAAAVLTGSLPPLLPVLAFGSALGAEPFVFVVAGLVAIALGWTTARLTGSRPWTTALNFLVWTALAMALGSAMGLALGHL